MKLVSAVRFTLGCALAAIIVAATLAKDAQQSVSGKVVAQSNASSPAGIPNVRVTCVGPDGTVHDDVGVATTNSKGLFTLQVPTKYATFALLFADTVNHYWPKQLDVSPKKNPLLLDPVQLHSQTLALSAIERKDIERIQQTLSGVDPAAASALYAALGHNSTGTDFFATGGGSSSSAIVLLASAYERNGGRGLNYQAVGSGAGIKQISAKTVTFGVTDKPFSVTELKESGLVQWPTAVTGLTVVVNVPGIQANEMTLNGQTLSDIYLGQIKSWDDPALAFLNPKLKLPALAIVPVHRADGSGASSTFTEYLSKVSKSWQAKVGQGTAVDWPGGLGAKGNEGVSMVVAKTNGAIGYVDYG